MRTIRRLAALLLTALLLAAPVSAATDVGTAFDDVPETHWAYDSVRWASHYGLVRGVGGKAFGLGRQVTRAEYATMLCRLLGWELISPETGSFSDNQDTSAWYYSAIETAHANGALPQISGACGPNEPIAREEMAAMVVRALGYGTLAGTVQNDCPFTDVSTNAGYIALAYRMGFIYGMNKWSFAPKDPCTREQAAAVLLRVYDRMHAQAAQGGAVPEGTAAIYAESVTGMETPVPLSPRAGLESVYAAAVKAGKGGAVALHTAPYRQTVQRGIVSAGETISEEALAELLADEATQTYRSARYGSSYLLRAEAGGSTTVVWYETAADLAEKADLCRLLGIGAVYFVE